jgi:hypothetical protein
VCFHCYGVSACSAVAAGPEGLRVVCQGRECQVFSTNFVAKLPGPVPGLEAAVWRLTSIAGLATPLLASTNPLWYSMTGAGLTGGLSCAVTDCEACLLGSNFLDRTAAACTSRICCGYRFAASMQAVPVSHARAAWAPLHHVCCSICSWTGSLQSPSVIARVGLWRSVKRLHMSIEWTNDHRQGQEDCRTDNINDCLEAGLMLQCQYPL